MNPVILKLKKTRKSNLYQKSDKLLSQTRKQIQIISGENTIKVQFLKNFSEEYDVLKEEIMLKAVHFDLFNDKMIKTKMFIQQIDNKIIDTTKTINKRKVRYIISLL